MSHTGFLGNFGKYFDTGTYSDVIIQSGTEQIRAHRIVLSQASPYFTSCFERGFKEETQPVLELKEDDPRAIRGLIAYTYGLHYDGQNSYTPFRRWPLMTLDHLSWIKYQIDLYVVAKKYMFDALATEITREFSAMLHAIVPATGFPEQLLEVARHLYLQYEGIVEELRRLSVPVLRGSVGLLKADQRFRELLSDSPELGLDLLSACDEKIQQLKSEKRKRKTPSSGPGIAFNKN